MGRFSHCILLCVFLSYLTLEIQQIRIFPENRFSRWCPYLWPFCLFCLDGRLFYMPLSLSCFLACLHAWCTVRHCSLFFFWMRLIYPVVSTFFCVCQWLFRVGFGNFSPDYHKLYHSTLLMKANLPVWSPNLLIRQTSRRSPIEN